MSREGEEGKEEEEGEEGRDRGEIRGVLCYQKAVIITAKASPVPGSAVTRDRAGGGGCGEGDGATLPRERRPFMTLVLATPLTPQKHDPQT